MKSRIIVLIVLLITGFACRKSNYSPPIISFPQDSLLNWELIDSIPGALLSDIWFTSSSEGFIVADKMYKTMDGGTSWAEITNTPGISNFYNLFFVSPQYGFAQGQSQLARTGKPQWMAPKPFKWDYRLFGKHDAKVPEPDETIDMLFTKQQAADKGFNPWMINGTAFDMMSMQSRFHLKEGKRYRLHMRNASDDLHPMHLHRHSFEITRFGGQPTAGIIKDVIMLGGFQEMDIDFTANNPGLTLFHCHMQLHMDFGFMALFDYV